MNPELDPNGIGSQLGADGVNGVIANVEQYCAHAVRCIALENKAPLAILVAEYGMLAKQAKAIEDQLRDAPPPGDARYYRRKKLFAWVVTGALTLAAFFLAVLTFAPFRLGWQSYVFSIGIVVVGPFLMEELFEGGKLDAWVKPLAAMALAAGLSSLMLMAHVRGNLLMHEVDTPPAVVIDDAQAEQPAQQDDFYSESTGLLSLATVLISLAMELGAGLAMRRAWAKMPHNAEDYQRFHRELTAIRVRMIVLGGRATQLEAEPGIFESRLWRDFYKSMLANTVQSAMRKLLVGLFALVLVSHAHAADPPKPFNLVIALDLTKSTNAKGPDGTTEFQKNVDGVTRILAQVPARSHVTVIGITDRSFAQPYILLSTSVPDDPGYFGERLSAAQRELARIWKQRSAKLEPRFPGTDILGALELASQIFNERAAAGEDRVVVLFSDMRNHTPELNLENPHGLTSAIKPHPAAPSSLDLRDAHIVALGVEQASPAPSDWNCLNDFWKKYLARNGATLDAFSVLRNIHLAAIQ